MKAYVRTVDCSISMLRNGSTLTKSAIARFDEFNDSRHPAHLGYASLRAVVAFHSHKIFPLSVTPRSSLGERQVTGVDLCQPWFYPRLMAYDYFWLSEEA